VQNTAVAPGAVAPQLGFFVEHRDVVADPALEQLVGHAEAHHAAADNYNVAGLVGHGWCESSSIGNSSSEFRSSGLLGVSQPCT